MLSGLHGGYGLRIVHEGRPAAVDYRSMLKGPEDLPGLPAFTLCPNIASWLDVMQQGQTSMCVTCRDSLRHTYLQRKLGRPNVMRPSPVWSYGQTHVGDLTEGTDPLQALRVLADLGACPWDLDPFDNLNETAAEAVASLHPDQNASAAQHRIGPHAVVPLDLPHLRAVFHQGFPVGLDGAVLPAFEQPQKMAVSPAAPDAFRLAIGHLSECAAVVPGSWDRQQALGGHGYLGWGTLPREYLPQPISEGALDYLVVSTTWGRWPGATGPGALFLLPWTYWPNLYEATVITDLAPAA